MVELSGNKQVRGFSFLRAIDAIEKGDFRGLAPLEYEISEQVNKLSFNSERNSIVVPMDVILGGPLE
jgi:hypothetical protein